LHRIQNVDELREGIDKFKYDFKRGDMKLLETTLTTTNIRFHKKDL